MRGRQDGPPGRGDPGVRSGLADSSLASLVAIAGRTGVDAGICRIPPHGHRFLQRLHVHALTRREAVLIVAELVSLKAAEVLPRLDSVDRGGAQSRVAAVSQRTNRLDWSLDKPPTADSTGVSSTIMATWEAPGGRVEPLDPVLVGYFEEAYLSPDAIPLFSRRVEDCTTEALADFMQDLRDKIRVDVTGRPRNLPMAARRMYLLLRLCGLDADAEYVKSVFDEPGEALADLWPLLVRLREAFSGSRAGREAMLCQAEQMMVHVIDALDGDVDTGVVAHLRRLCNLIEEGPLWDGTGSEVDTEIDSIGRLVNDFFYDRLAAHSPIRRHLMDLESEAWLSV